MEEQNSLHLEKCSISPNKNKMKAFDIVSESNKKVAADSVTQSTIFSESVDQDESKPNTDKPKDNLFISLMKDVKAKLKDRSVAHLKKDITEGTESMELSIVFSKDECTVKIRKPLIVDFVAANDQVFLSIMEILRMRNRGLRMGALSFDAEANCIVGGIKMNYYGDDDTEAFFQEIRKDTANILSNVVATSQHLMRNNTSLFFDGNITYEGVRERILARKSNNERREKICEKIEQLIKHKNDVKCIQNIEILREVDQRKLIGRGGFCEVYSQTFEYKILNDGKSELATGRLAYKTVKTEPVDEKRRRARVGLNEEDEYKDGVATRSKQIQKRKQSVERLGKENLFVKKRLSGIVSKHIMSYFIASAPKADTPQLYMEVCPYSDLHVLLKNDRILSFSSKVQIGLGIVNGLIELHRKEIIHHDLKPQNIFIFYGKTPKLGDFGESMIKGKDQKSVGFTPYYQAPPTGEEGSDGKKKKYKPQVFADVFALGLTFAELFFDIMPSTIEYKRDMTKEIQIQAVSAKISAAVDKAPLLKLFYEAIQSLISFCLNAKNFQKVPKRKSKSKKIEEETRPKSVIFDRLNQLWEKASSGEDTQIMQLIYDCLKEIFMYYQLGFFGN